VDCPDNAINVWIALGPVLRGNGLTVFADDYRTEFTFRDGYIESGQKIHQPLTFDLQPGDAVLFHSNHLHGSELNRTDSTRYVVSYRITFGRPHYPHGHYHHYLHGGLAASRFRWLAGVPQNLQMSFVAQQVRRVRHKVTGRGKMSGTDGSRTSAHSGQESIEEGDSIALAGFQVGSIRPVSKAVCIARLAETKFAAVSRRCPHMGGDLADGWVDDEQQIVCPWHSMSFDPHTGASRCNVLPPLRVFSWDVRGDRVHVDVDRVSESAPSRDRP
jgi:nitrite reductase/ring-hydroxylating ferredoxin subunit